MSYAEGGKPLWLDKGPLHVLSKLGSMRRAGFPIAGIPERADMSHEMIGIFALEHMLTRSINRQIFLDEIQEKCGFSNVAWMRPMLHIDQILRAFFNETSNWPVFMSIVPRRAVPGNKQSRIFTTTQRCGTRTPIPPGVITVAGRAIPYDDGLVKPERADGINYLVSQSIERVLYHPTYKDYATTEFWTYYSSIDDPRHSSDAENGRIPSMEGFVSDGVRNSPLISLIKFHPSMTYLHLFCFYLHPHTGHRIDYREMFYPTEFFLNWDTINHGLMLQAITTGFHETIRYHV